MEDQGNSHDSADDADQSSQATSASNPSDSDSSGSPTPMDMAALVVKPTRRSRTRPKDELAQLRRQEHDLVAKMRELRVETRRQVVRSSQTGASGGDASRQHSLLFWERAAARQLQHRQRSEQENRRLKMLLQTQIRQARQLQQALARRLVESVQFNVRSNLYRSARNVDIRCWIGRSRWGRTNQLRTAFQVTTRPCSRLCSTTST